MSSEYSMHLSNRSLEGRVVDLGESYGHTIALISEATEPANRERFTLFIKDDRLLEMSLLFHKIAQDLAALLPDVDACCRCEQCRADAEAERQREPTDTIPREEAAEHVEPPHRWG